MVPAPRWRHDTLDADVGAATSAAEHDNAIRYDYPMSSRPMIGKEFVSALSGGDAVEDAGRGY